MKAMAAAGTGAEAALAAEVTGSSRC